jgi:hypothetical protein
MPKCSLTRDNYGEFRAQLYIMHELSLQINTAAALYAGIISDVINPGFSRVVQSAYDDGGETNISVILYNKERDMKDYLSQAESIWVARQNAAGDKLVQQLQELKTSHEEAKKQGF